MTPEEFAEKFLPNEARTAFMQNVLAERHDKIFRVRSTPWATLGSAFNWSSTPQGNDYWAPLYNKMFKLYQIPLADFLEHYFTPPIAARLLSHILQARYSDELEMISKYTDPKDVLYWFNWSSSAEGERYWASIATTLPTNLHFTRVTIGGQDDI